VPRTCVRGRRASCAARRRCPYRTSSPSDSWRCRRRPSSIPRCGTPSDALTSPPPRPAPAPRVGRPQPDQPERPRRRPRARGRGARPARSAPSSRRRQRSHSGGPQHPPRARLWQRRGRDPLGQRPGGPRGQHLPDVGGARREQRATGRENRTQPNADGRFLDRLPADDPESHVR
jgi:hypothetical protein